MVTQIRIASFCQPGLSSRLFLFIKEKFKWGDTVTSTHKIYKQDFRGQPMANKVEIKYTGGNAQQEVNAILAKIVLSKLAEKEKKDESSNI